MWGLIDLSKSKAISACGLLFLTALEIDYVLAH